MAQVTLIIDATGNTTVEVHGVTGPQCQELTRNVERLLGTVQTVTHKPGFHDQCRESAQNNAGQF
jgi:hypothetical protein